MARVKNKLITSLLAVALAFSLTACDDEACEHTYDNACDTICNICNEERTITHTPNADDNDCTTAITCSVCGTVTTEAQERHTPNPDDNDCTTAITCSVCGTVTTEAQEHHTPNPDDNDCTTAITCSVCGTVTTEMQEHDFTGELVKGETQHWHDCENENCIVTDDKIDHKAEKQTYVWAVDNTTCTATASCIDCEKELTTETVTASVNGTIYTAVFENAIFATQTKEMINLATLTETYVIKDSKTYSFFGSGNYGVKVESGNPTIILENATITLTDGYYYDGNMISVIDIVATNSATTVKVVGENSLTAKDGAGIFVAESSIVKITSDSRENSLTVKGGNGGCGIGGYTFLDEDYGANGVDCGDIEIATVTVKAYGSMSDLADTCPAIGGAANGNCGYVTINNATVYAEGYIDANHNIYGSAAIGVGQDFIYCESGTIGAITISNNSTVYLTKGSHSDYIGYSADIYEPATGEVLFATIDETSEIVKQN